MVEGSKLHDVVATAQLREKHYSLFARLQPQNRKFRGHGARDGSGAYSHFFEPRKKANSNVAGTSISRILLQVQRFSPKHFEKTIVKSNFKEKSGTLQIFIRFQENLEEFQENSCKILKKIASKCTKFYELTSKSLVPVAHTST